MMRAMREKKDMSQQAVALEIGVERSTVAKWESGKSRPRAELLPKLAKLFGCSIEELLVPGGPEKTA
ncbi:helix-turn-helix transcriptional regulator [Ruthenibacterium lactatiformans]|jgi:putative transcriptional regulator|nr:MAG TPA: Repressor protein CI [Caudoviricetes sp.]